MDCIGVLLFSLLRGLFPVLSHLGMTHVYKNTADTSWPIVRHLFSEECDDHRGEFIHGHVMILA